MHRDDTATDLRHGSITGKHNEHVALPADVACFALAGSLLAGKSTAAEALLGMSFLSRVGWKVEQDVLVLESKY